MQCKFEPRIKEKQMVEENMNSSTPVMWISADGSLRSMVDGANTPVKQRLKEDDSNKLNILCLFWFNFLFLSFHSVVLMLWLSLSTNTTWLLLGTYHGLT